MVKEERVFTKEDLLLQKRKRATNIQAQKNKERLAFEAGRAAAIAMSRRQKVDFNWEQKRLQELFGNGEHVWGLPEEESGTKVTINHDLNPNINGQADGTSNLFGFGSQQREVNDDTKKLFFK